MTYHSRYTSQIRRTLLLNPFRLPGLQLAAILEEWVVAEVVLDSLASANLDLTDTLPNSIAKRYHTFDVTSHHRTICSTWYVVVLRSVVCGSARSTTELAMSAALGPIPLRRVRLSDPVEYVHDVDKVMLRRKTSAWMKRYRCPSFHRLSSHSRTKRHIMTEISACLSRMGNKTQKR